MWCIAYVFLFQISIEVLTEKIEKIGGLLLVPWFGRDEVKSFRKEVGDLMDTMTKYRDYLSDQLRRVTRNQNDEEPAASTGKRRFTFRDIAPTSETVSPHYYDLDDDLKRLQNYEPISLTDYVPEERFRRRDWIESMTLSSAISMYSYFPGGSCQGLHFIWKVPVHKQDRSDENTLKVITELQKNLPFHSNRQMRREFFDRYANVRSLTPGILRDMYRTLTNDNSAPENERQKAMDARVCAFLLESDDPDLVVDLRSMNGDPGTSKFDIFWAEVGAYLNEINTAAQERRHGANSYLPFAISVEDFRQTIIERVPEATAIPSTEWLRLQFWPSNQTTNRALHHTGRFQVRFAIQHRQLRQEHIDSKFAQWQYQLMKHFVILNRDNCSLFCLDDKAIVPIGNPGIPISTGVRGHNSSITSTEGHQLLALDHDFHLCGIVPSLALEVEIPDSIKHSFYQGRIFVTLKDKILQASSPLRHGQELLSIIRENSSADGVISSKPILINYTDGGPDHRTTYGSVMVAAVILFVLLDLDMFAAVRTAPHGSWANPAERGMSLLNLALQNCSLSRSKMDDECEKKYRGAGTMADVRTLCKTIGNNDNNTFKDQLRQSMREPTEILEKRFSRLKLKGVPVVTHEAATDNDLSDFFKVLSDIFSSTLLPDRLRLGHLKKSEKLWNFMSSHCKATHYTYQLKKCKSPTCWYCLLNPPRLEDFNDLDFIPDPILTEDKQHYKSFEDVYRTETTDDDRPSLQTEANKKNPRDVINKDLLVGTRARTFIACSDCGKSRVVYSKTKLSKLAGDAVRRVCEQNTYCCGDPLFPESGISYDSIVVREGITCTSPMETTYYSNIITRFEPCCFHCGAFDDLIQDDDEMMLTLKQSYTMVRPLCSRCRSKGRTAETRGKKNVGGKRRKTD